MRAIPLWGIQDPVASLSHFLAAGLTLYGGYRLILKTRGNGLRVGASLLYLGCLLFLFSMSGLYHSLHPGPWRAYFRRLDYMGIWLVIAGSATPIHMLLMRGPWRWGMLALFWAGALSCLFFVNDHFRALSYPTIVCLYMAVGGLGTISFYRLHQKFGLRKLGLLAFGGFAYALGAVIDAVGRPVLWKGVLGPHEIFHLLVMAGAASHYLFIYGWADVRMRKVRAFTRAWSRRRAAGRPAPGLAPEAAPEPAP
ncbi:MAG: hemolysin III family protein, partial [Elusimicrobia bacterium]|nr:hemolysin III family protein [Elusimicrobiota bacterium]